MRKIEGGLLLSQFLLYLFISSHLSSLLATLAILSFPTLARLLAYLSTSIFHVLFRSLF